MNTKLTLRLDEDLIRGAKRHAARRGTSVSELVAGFFAVLAVDEGVETRELSPRVRGLVGALREPGSPDAASPDARPADADSPSAGVGAYRRYLEDKFR